jgi:hypothetical protein
MLFDSLEKNNGSQLGVTISGCVPKLADILCTKHFNIAATKCVFVVLVQQGLPE